MNLRQVGLSEVIICSFFFIKKISLFSFSGPLIDDIMDNIQNLITNKSKGWKAKIYSGVILI